jgi:hypothetical protein
MHQDVLTRNVVEITLDKTRHLYYGMNAFCEFEGVAGRTIPAVFAEFGGGANETDPAKVAAGFSFNTLRMLLWAGLQEEDPSLTLRDAGNLMDTAPGLDVGEKLRYVVEKITAAFAKGKITAPDDDKKKVEPQSQARKT